MTERYHVVSTQDTPSTLDSSALAEAPSGQEALWTLLGAAAVLAAAAAWSFGSPEIRVDAGRRMKRAFC